MGRAYNFWMLNCWCITWPVGFKRFNTEWLYTSTPINVHGVDRALPFYVCLGSWSCTISCVSLDVYSLTNSRQINAIHKSFGFEWLGSEVVIWKKALHDVLQLECFQPLEVHSGYSQQQYLQVLRARVRARVVWKLLRLHSTRLKNRLRCSYED